MQLSNYYLLPRYYTNTRLNYSKDCNNMFLGNFFLQIIQLCSNKCFSDVHAAISTTCSFPTSTGRQVCHVMICTNKAGSSFQGELRTMTYEGKDGRASSLRYVHVTWYALLQLSILYIYRIAVVASQYAPLNKTQYPY